MLDAPAAATTGDSIMGSAATASTDAATATAAIIDEGGILGGYFGFGGLDYLYSLSSMLTMNLWLADSAAAATSAAAEPGRGGPVPGPMPALDEARCSPPPYLSLCYPSTPTPIPRLPSAASASAANTAAVANIFYWF
eukprot:COSAG05_NODE_6346_length_976_cov_3.953250_2_plen_138_part_00